MYLYHGYFITAVAAVAQVCVYPGTSAGMTWVVDGICRDLNLTRGHISMLYMVGTFLGATLQPLIGWAIDRCGGRLLVPIMATAYAAALMALGATYSPVGLTLVWTVIRGLGIGGLVLGNNVLIQNFWKSRRAVMSSVVEGFNAMVGFGISAYALSEMVKAVGWRAAYQYVGLGVAAVLVLPAMLLLRENPESMGLLPDGVEAPKEVHLVLEEKGRCDEDEGARLQCGVAQDELSVGQEEGIAVSAPAAVGLTPGRDGSGGDVIDNEQLKGWTRAQALLTSAFWSIALMNCYMATAGAGVFFHLASITADAGLADGLLAGLVFPSWALSRFGMIVCTGILMGRMSHARWLLCGNILQTVAMFLLIDLNRPWKGLLFGLTLGCGGGINQVVNRVVLAEYFGRAHLGSISGLIQIVAVASTSVGPYFLGVSFDADGSYRFPLQCIVASGLAVSAILACTGPPGSPPTVMPVAVAYETLDGLPTPRAAPAAPCLDPNLGTGAKVEMQINPS